MKNDFGGLLVTEGDVTYVPHQNWWSDTLRTAYRGRGVIYCINFDIFSFKNVGVESIL